MIFQEIRTLLLAAGLIWCQVMEVEATATDGERLEPVVIEALSPAAQLIAEKKGNRSIRIEGDEFLLDGVPLQIISGSLHYFRVPAAYWRDRLYKLKAAGLNSVATYVEWSFHETEERQYSFAGDRDLAQFVRLAAEEGLHVLLRPGPYICAERDLGGLPYWLLSKYPQKILRSSNKGIQYRSDFIKETSTWMAKLFDQLTSLLYGNGGPIILVQVENEYGSYGKDHVYMENIRDIIRSHVGTNAILYTTDGTSLDLIRNGHVSDTFTSIDFGVGQNVKTVFSNLRTIMPRGPLMNSEFYPGWLTHWGEAFQRVDTESVVKSFQDMLKANVNVNFYMFFGGTNFEFTAGANYFSKFQPDITSYDYDAPLSEAGDPTPKYYAIREVMIEHTPSLRDIPPPIPSHKGAYGEFAMVPFKKILSPAGRSALGKRYNDVTGGVLPTFEQLRQRAGLMLFETTLNDSDSILQISAPRDWIYVYVDNVLQGVLNRMNKKYTLPISSKIGSVLSLLVEPQGRINYGPRIHDYKGILSSVLYNNITLSGNWTVTGYPLENVKLDASSGIGNEGGPILYKGSFTLPKGEEPLDTFLDTTGWGKGYIWINGQNLGRYWPTMGPQVTLYVPGVWLRAAPSENIIAILELEDGPADLKIRFIDYPILNRRSTSL